VGGSAAALICVPINDITSDFAQVSGPALTLLEPLDMGADTQPTTASIAAHEVMI